MFNTDVPKNSLENFKDLQLAEIPTKLKVSMMFKDIKNLVQNNDKITENIDEVVEVNTSETKVTTNCAENHRERVGRNM